MKHCIRLLASLALCSSFALPSQQNIAYYPNNTIGTAKNFFPFGAARNGVRQQDLIPGTVFGSGPVLIQDLYWCAAGPPTGNTQTEGEVVYGDFEIRMGVTSVTTLTSAWATNLPNPTTVHKGRLRLRWKNGVFTPIGLQVPFLFAPTNPGDNLCVDFILWSMTDTGGIVPDVNGYVIGANYDSTAPRCWLLNWPINQGGAANVGLNGLRLGFLLGNGNFVARGSGCATSAATVPAISNAPSSWPTLGQNFSFQVQKAAPGTLAFPMLGSSETTWGPFALPYDLTPLNATGCQLWIDPLVTLQGSLTDASGAATTTVGVPNNTALIGGRLYSTWLSLDAAANGLGLVTSDYGLLILGT